MIERDINDGSTGSFIGAGMIITGETSFNGTLRVDGQIHGHLVSTEGTLIVGECGKVEADVHVSIALISGVVVGNIVADQRIVIGRNARVHGNIQSASVSIEQGAVFDGSCKMTAAETQEVVKTGLMPNQQTAVEDFSALAAQLEAAVQDDLATHVNFKRFP